MGIWEGFYMNLDHHHALLAIIPTVLIPLTAVSVLLSSVAVFVAGLFGIKLKAEGPKKLLEVLLKPRVLVSAAILNVAVFGGVRLVRYAHNSSSLDAVVHYRQGRIKAGSERTYTDTADEMPAQTERRRRARKSVEAEPEWNVKLPKGPFSTPVVSGSSAFVGSNDGYVYELNAADGAIVRKFFVGTEVSPSPLIFRGYLYAGEGAHDTHHARVSKFDLKTGDYVGFYRTTGHIEGQFSVDQKGDGTQLYAPGGEGGLYAIDPLTMKLKWKAEVGHTDAGARFDADLVFFGTGREKFAVDKYRSWAVAVGRSSGAIVWKREIPASSWMEPVLLGDRVCFVFGEVYFESAIGGLGCFKKNSGASAGIFYHDAPIVSPPLVLGDQIFITDVNGQVCRVSTATLEKSWCHTALQKGKTFSGVKYDPGTDSLVQVTRKEGIYFLDPDSGDTLGRWPKDPAQATEAFAAPAVDAGHILFANQAGDVVKLRIGSLDL
jgi:outer membrane protein assembly factor BamB